MRVVYFSSGAAKRKITLLMSENDYNAYWERMEQEWEQDAVGSKRTMKKSISNHVERLRVKRQHEKNRETGAFLFALNFL